MVKLRWRLCFAADGNGSCHGLAPSFIKEMIRCRHQKHHQRWPSNSKSRLKFHKYRAYRPILRLRNHDWCFTADGSFQKSFKWHLADVKKHRRRWPGNLKDWLKFRNYQNLHLQYQARPLEKHLFAARRPPLWCHCVTFFSYYHSQQLLFSPTKNNFSMTLTPTKKPNYTYWRVSL